LALLGLMLSLLSWPWDARLIRSVILSLREREFTKTAILSGTGTVSLVLKEYLPFATPLIFSENSMLSPTLMVSEPWEKRVLSVRSSALSTNSPKYSAPDCR
ncbi:MAG TPA: ABC transporter permease subunit, partial [Anaerolineales bacterium]|nr:ABC transporter permease subunit [Anaerolineales bacterium]